jgi:biopolymer transport protein ExbD
MALKKWSRHSLVLLAAILAIGGLLISSASSQDDGDQEKDTSPEKPKAHAAQAAKTLTITISAAENGQMSSLRVGLAKLFEGSVLEGNRLRELDKRLKDVFAIEGTSEQILLRVDKRLNSGELIEVLHVCDKQKIADGGPIKKISFVVLGEK